MCSRIKYETGRGTYIVGRCMDWSDATAKTRLWFFPKGMQRDGGAGDNSFKWVSKYGSVCTSFYDAGTADGMNEAGLVGNMLYLAESVYPDPEKTGKPKLSIGAWLQYFLDQYATVDEAMECLSDLPFALVAPKLPNGKSAAVHFALSDTKGDSVIVEYLNAELVIHHGPQYCVLTNSPTYDKQLALNAYWDLIGGSHMLPGTISAADRFVRLSYNLKSSPKYTDQRMAVASVFSQMRAIGVPLGMDDPEHPNIASTLWRTVSDQGARRYFFESTIQPSVFWVDLDKVDLAPGAAVKSLEINSGKDLAGEISHEFEPKEPFKWL